MNRLSYGAAGLLLALSLTAIISSTSADPSEAKTEYYKTHNSDRARNLTGMTVNTVLKYNDAKMRQYILRVGNYLTTHNVFGSQKTKDCKNLKRHQMEESCLNNDRIKNALNKDFLKSKNTAQLRVYVKFFYSVAYGYLHNLQKGIHNATTNHIYFQALDALKADGDINEEQHTRHSDKFKEYLHEGGYADHVNQEEAYEKFHFKSALKSRKQWDDAYAALPESEKYTGIGSNPIRKERLYKDLKVAFTEEQDEKAYAIAKEASAKHLEALAQDAKNEALPSATNSAGIYLRDNPEYKEMLKHIHDHPTPGSFRG